MLSNFDADARDRFKVYFSSCVKKCKHTHVGYGWGFFLVGRDPVLRDDETQEHALGNTKEALLRV